VSEPCRVQRRGIVHYVYIDWRYLGELLAAGREVYGELKDLCVSVKTLRWNGLALSQPARAYSGFQTGARLASQQHPTRPQP
jgi:hypothetical protein